MMPQRHATRKYLLFPQWKQLVIILLFPLIMALQLNLPPLERHPGWDAFWEDARIVSKLAFFQQSFKDGELPVLNSYVNLGWNMAGDPKDPASWASPTNLLLTCLSPQQVALAQWILLLALGGVGTFLFLGLFTSNSLIKLFGAMTFMSLPLSIESEFMYFEGFLVFNTIPLLLFLIRQWQYNIRSTYYAALLMIGLIFSWAYGNVYWLVIILTIVPAWAFFVNFFERQKSFFHALRMAAMLTLVALAMGLFYLVPLFVNLWEAKKIWLSITEANIGVPTNPLTARGFLEYFVKYNYGALFRPNQSQGMLLYLPYAFFMTLGVGLFLKRLIFPEKGHYYWAVVFFIGLSGILFCHSILYYCLPGISAQESGASFFRHQLNSIPYLLCLATFIVFSQILDYASSWKWPLLGVILLPSVINDIMLFWAYIPYPHEVFDIINYVSHSPIAPFGSSNRFSIHILSNMWILLPIINAGLLCLAFCLGVERSSKRFFGKFQTITVIFGVALASLFNVSLHNDLRIYQQQSWQQMTKDSYRIETYFQRKSCIDALISRKDFNFRTLYTGDYSIDSGRSYMTMAETELNTVFKEKALFSRRQFDHPYTGLIRGAFGGKIWKGNFWPPNAQSVDESPALLRLLGIRWVISADRPLNGAHFLLKGSCETPLNTNDPNGGGSGKVLVYEIKEPSSIARLYREKENLPRNKIFQNIFNAKTSSFLAEQESTQPLNLKILKETSNSFVVSVDPDMEGRLVVSNVYRRFWNAKTSEGLQLIVAHAFGGLLSVDMPLGTQSVEFYYRPYDVYLGISLTIIAICVFFSVSILIRRSSEAII